MPLRLLHFANCQDRLAEILTLQHTHKSVRGIVDPLGDTLLCYESSVVDPFGNILLMVDSIFGTHIRIVH